MCPPKENTAVRIGLPNGSWNDIKWQCLLASSTQVSRSYMVQHWVQNCIPQASSDLMKAASLQPSSTSLTLLLKASTSPSLECTKKLKKIVMPKLDSRTFYQLMAAYSLHQKPATSSMVILTLKGRQHDNSAVPGAATCISFYSHAYLTLSVPKCILVSIGTQHSRLKQGLCMLS